MDDACSMHGREDKLNKILIGKPAEYVSGVYGNMILKLILEKWDGKM
jgi:hypothetical protein